jgi:hypothetical protein
MAARKMMSSYMPHFLVAVLLLLEDPPPDIAFVFQ